AGVAQDPGRQDGDLYRDRQAHRPAQGGARGGGGLRRQPARGRDPVPSGGAARRRPRRLSLGRSTQARGAGEGEGGMSRHTHGAGAPSPRVRGEGLAPQTRNLEVRTRGESPSPRPSPPEEGGEGALSARIAAFDWDGIAAALDANGCATTGPLLDADA